MLQTEDAPTGLAKYIPILGWVPKYQQAWLRADLLAGVVAAAVVIPQAMAYAAIAGLPVQAAAILNLEASGVKLVGAIPSGLPRLSLPDGSLFETLWLGALGVALMSSSLLPGSW